MIKGVKLQTHVKKQKSKNKDSNCTVREDSSICLLPYIIR